MLRTVLSKVDSQRFWDLMDAVPLKAIETIETEQLKKARTCYGFDSDSLFCDTANFVMFIAIRPMEKRPITSRPL